MGKIHLEFWGRVSLASSFSCYGGAKTCLSMYIPTCVAKLAMYCDPYLTPAFVNYTSCVYLHKKSLCL